MVRIWTRRRAATFAKPAQRSCTKHGPYEGPYCVECYKKTVEADEERPND